MLVSLINCSGFRIALKLIEIQVSFKGFSGGLIYGCLVNSTRWSLHHFDFVQAKKGGKRSFGDSFGDGNAFSPNERGRRPNHLWGSDFIFLFESGSGVVRNYEKRILVEVYCKDITENLTKTTSTLLASV